MFTTLLNVIGKGRALYQYVGARLKSTAIAGVMSAMHETSVLFAAVIGVTQMRAKLSVRQWMIALIIVFGLITLRV